MAARDDIVIDIRAEDRFTPVFGRLGAGIITLNQGLQLAQQVVRPLAQGLQQVLETTDRFRRMEIQLTSLQGSAATARESMARLQEIARTTPQTLQTLTDAFVRLEAGGLSDSERTLRALIDAVAAFGGSDAEFQRAAIAIQQMAGKGVISMEELRQQLGEAIPTATRIMAREMGMSMQEFVDLVSQGGVEAERGIAALTRGLERDFAGAAKRMENTWAQATSNMQDAWDQFLRAIGEQGILDDAVTVVKTLTEALNALTAALNAQPQVWEAFKDSLVNILPMVRELRGLLAAAGLIDAAGDSSNLEDLGLFTGSRGGGRALPTQDPTLAGRSAPVAKAAQEAANSLRLLAGTAEELGFSALDTFGVHVEEAGERLNLLTGSAEELGFAVLGEFGTAVEETTERLNLLRGSAEELGFAVLGASENVRTGAQAPAGNTQAIEMGNVIADVFIADLLTDLRGVLQSAFAVVGAEVLADPRMVAALESLRDALMPLVEPLVEAIAPALEALVPGIEAIVEGLIPVIEALGPVLLEVVEALVPLLREMAPLLKDLAVVIRELTPALRVLIKAIQLQLIPIMAATRATMHLLAQVLEALHEVADALRSAMDTLESAIRTLTDAVQRLADQFGVGGGDGGSGVPGFPTITVPELHGGSHGPIGPGRLAHLPGMAPDEGLALLQEDEEVVGPGGRSGAPFIGTAVFQGDPRAIREELRQLLEEMRLKGRLAFN